MELQDIKSMTLAEIQESFTNDKLPKFRALQVYQWLHRGAESFDEMSNLSKELREQLKAKYYISVATVEKKLISCLLYTSYQRDCNRGRRYFNKSMPSC